MDREKLSKANEITEEMESLELIISGMKDGENVVKVAFEWPTISGSLEAITSDPYVVNDSICGDIFDILQKRRDDLKKQLDLL